VQQIALANDLIMYYLTLSIQMYRQLPFSMPPFTVFTAVASVAIVKNEPISEQQSTVSQHATAMSQ
jgi:hypothetical protein